jgi:hypothetical protein
VHGEDLLIDYCSNWETVEAIGKSLPQFDVISSLAFIVKSVDTVNGSAFVVSTENEEIFRILDLVG